MNEVQGVLFDLDGTLIDTYQIILASMRYATACVLGAELPEAVLMQKVGQPLEVQMADFTPNEATVTELARVYREHNDGVHDRLVAAFPGVPEALAALHAAGYALGVVTSKRHAMAERGLRLSGIAAALPVVVGADDWPEHKPEPGCVEYGCSLLGLPPERVLYVGDSPTDMAAGNAAGCLTAAVCWGMFTRDVLAAQKPDFMLAETAELVPLLQRL